MDESSKKLTHNYLFTLLAQACQLLEPMITMPYISRVLGVENIGVYSTSVASAAYFVLAANFGSSVYGQKRIAADGIDLEERSGTFYSVIIFRFFPFILSLIAWILYVFHIGGGRTILLIQGISIISVFLDISWFFQGLEDFRRTSLRIVFFRILAASAVFLFVKSDQDTVKYAFIELTCAALGNLSLWPRLSGLICVPQKGLIHPLDCLKECFQFFVPGLAVQTYTALDKMMLNTIGGSLAENGYYEQASKIVRFITSVLTVYSNVWFPRMSLLFKNDSETIKGRARKEIQQGAQFVTFLGLPLVIALEIIAPVLTVIYLGESFKKSALLIRILTPNILIIGISTALGQQFYNPSGRQNISTIFVFAGAFLNLLLNRLLIPRILSVGTSIASLLTETLITLLFIVYAEKNHYFDMLQFLKGGWKHLCAALIMGGIILVMPKQNLIQLCFTAAAGVCVYPTVLFLLKDEQLRAFWGSLK